MSSITHSILGAIAGVMLIALTPLVAHAEEPPGNINGRVYDSSGVLNNTEAAGSQLDEASDLDGELYAFFVPDFSGIGETKWCVGALTNIGVGQNAMALVVATEQRRMGFCKGSEVALDNSQAENLQNAVKSELSSDNWNGAVEAYARSYTERSSTGSSSSGGSFMPLLFIGFVVIVVLIVLAALSRKKKQTDGDATGTAEPPATPEELIQQASLAAAELDTLVREAQEEAEFTRLSLGANTAGEYQQVLDDARTKRDRVFEMLKQMGSLSETHEKAQVAGNIVKLSGQTRESLRDIHERVAAAQNQQANAQANLQDISAKLDDTEQQIPLMEAELKALKAEFPATATPSIEDNPQQARDLIEAGREAVRSGNQSWSEGNLTAAAHYAQLASRMLTQSIIQLDQIQQARETLADSRGRLTAAVASISSDLSDAARATELQAALAPLVADAQAAIAEGQDAQGGGGDPLAALEHLATAEDALDAALAEQRETWQVEEKLQARYSALLADVDAVITQADNYISTRRGIVDENARALIAEARSLRAQAVAATETSAGISLLGQAKASANKAISTARVSEVSFRSGDNIAPRISNSDSSFVGAVIGGVMGSMLSGGGNNHSGGGFGGFSGGGFFGGGGFSGFGGSSF
ncbi:MAG: TPM domain-containing protein [Varibaculum sp.]|nr:TPM domain-containing protein [Varibaculum sp.]